MVGTRPGDGCNEVSSRPDDRFGGSPRKTARNGFSSIGDTGTVEGFAPDTECGR